MNVDTLKTAESILVDQINTVTDAVRRIAQDKVTEAMTNLKSEVVAARERISQTRSAMCAELSNLLADIVSLTGEIECGMTALPYDFPLLGVPAVLHDVSPTVSPTVSPEQFPLEVSSESVSPETLSPAQEQVRKIQISYPEMLPMEQRGEPTVQDDMPLDRSKTLSEAIGEQKDTDPVSVMTKACNATVDSADDVLPCPSSNGHGTARKRTNRKNSKK